MKFWAPFAGTFLSSTAPRRPQVIRLIRLPRHYSVYLHPGTSRPGLNTFRTSARTVRNLSSPSKVRAFRFARCIFPALQQFRNRIWSRHPARFSILNTPKKISRRSRRSNSFRFIVTSVISAQNFSRQPCRWKILRRVRAESRLRSPSQRAWSIRGRDRNGMATKSLQSMIWRARSA